MEEERHLKNWHRDTPNPPVMPYNTLISNQPMTNPITPKVAYIPLEYHMSVEDFLEVWKDMGMEEEPTQEDYNTAVLDRAQSYFHDMRGMFEKYIRLENA